jgi:hypothetical protein
VASSVQLDAPKGAASGRRVRYLLYYALACGLFLLLWILTLPTRR